MPGGAQLEPHTLNQLLSSVIGTVAVAAAPGTCVSLLANRVGAQAHKFSDCPLRGLHGSPGSTPPGAGDLKRNQSSERSIIFWSTRSAPRYLSLFFSARGSLDSGIVIVNSTGYRREKPVADLRRERRANHDDREGALHARIHSFAAHPAAIQCTNGPRPDLTAHRKIAALQALSARQPPRNRRPTSGSRRRSRPLPAIASSPDTST